MSYFRDHLPALVAAVREAREALEPFCLPSQLFGVGYGDGYPVRVPLGDCRRAAYVLREAKG
jgi:hypothetical protein